MTEVSRRYALDATAAAAGSLTFPGLAFGQAQFKLKFASIMPSDHPLNQSRALDSALKSWLSAQPFAMNHSQETK